MSNLEIWDALGKTDPAHTKRFKRAGGFEGTAVKPIWTERRLTEYFGPCGVGWGFDKPEFQTVTVGEEVLVYCTVRAWHGNPNNTLYGVGGDKVASKNKYGLQIDDEAFKKAATDAIGNAFKHIGCGADVHMGQFDDSKYVADTRMEFAANDAKAEANERINNPKGRAPAKRGPVLDGPHKSESALMAEARRIVHELHACGDSDMFEAFLADADNVASLKQMRNDAPQLLDGGPDMHPDYVPINTLIKRMRADFAMIENSALRAG